MVLGYILSSREMDILLPVLKNLRVQHQKMEASCKSFQAALSSLKDAQVQTDLGSIQKALDTLQGLLVQCFDPAQQEVLSDRQHLREVRHDFRAAIGGVMGYIELLQDFLKDEGLAEALELSIPFYKVAYDSLEIIDGLSFEAEEISENETDGDDVYVLDHLTGHVLIVDDSREKQEQLSRRLKVMGQQISLVNSGPAALDFLKKNEVDIILLDLLMPGMNGDEVLRALKKNEELKHLPVLMVSSASDMENIVDCIRLGADDYLAMPLNNTLLHARINACLTKKKSRDREQETLAMLDASQQQLTTAIENIDEGFAVFDANDFLTTYNKKFAEFYPVVEDFQQEAVYYKLLIQAGIEKNLYQLIKHDSCALQTSKFSPKDGSKFLKGYLAFHANPTRPRVDLLTTGLWVEVIENKIPGGGTVAIHKDISAIKRTEEALHYTAMHDALTGLANRKNFDKVLESVTKEAKKKNEQFAIMFFDLDGFKNINDTLGHDFGDLVLQTVAGKLKESVRDKDLVARFGGDEFAAVITNIPSMDECILIAERCLKTIGTEVERNGKVATFGVSIGIALYPNHAEHTVELLKKADEAMYVAKKSGKGTYRMAS